MDYPPWHYARKTENTVDNLFCDKCWEFKYRFPEEKKVPILQGLLALLPCIHDFRLKQALFHSRDDPQQYLWECSKCGKKRIDG